MIVIRFKISDKWSINTAVFFDSHIQIMRVLLLALVLCLAACQNPTPPILPEQFTMEFEEASQLIVIGITQGTMYYDDTNKREAIFRYNGRYDRYCGTVYKNQETPCRHVVVNGKLQFTQESDILTSPKENSAASAVTIAMDVESYAEISSSDPTPFTRVLTMTLTIKAPTSSGSSREIKRTSTTTRTMP
jgi:hypothetical protein